MNHSYLLLITFLLPSCLALQELVLVLDQTVCWNCSDPQGCREDVVGASQTVRAVNWSLQRLEQLNLVDRDNYRLETLDTCSQETQAQWEIVKSLGHLADEERINMSHPLHLVLASQLNKVLEGEISGLPTSISSIPPTSSFSLTRAAARLLASLHWRRVAVLSDPEFSLLLGSQMAREDICVLHSEAVPSLLHTKDSYTRLLTGLAEVGVDKLVVGADGADIVRLVRNIHQLNLNMSVLALPWDGSVEDMPGSEQETVEVTQMLQTFSNLPEFLEEAGLEYEHLRSWEVVRSLYGLLVEGEVGVDDETVRQGMQLRREREGYRVERMGRSGWRSVGVLESGQLRWTGRGERIEEGEESESCPSCQCVNGVAGPGLVWRAEHWVTALVCVAGLGLISCFLISAFLCSQCGQVLEGSQATSLSLLAATTVLFLSLLPFCFLPHSLVCALRELGPPLVSSLVLAVMLSRSLLLATADTDGLPGHASGALQVVLGILLLGVEVSVLLVLALTRQDSHSFTELVRLGPASSLHCSHGGWPWLLTMIWPGLLLVLQLLLTPVIWSSRRNYREGTLLSLASLVLVLVTAGWLAMFFVCSEMYGEHWQEISTAAGLVASAVTIILVIFIPKVYMMNMWGRGSEISLHLPDTATSTLHTDTIDYVRGTDIYKMSDSDVLYDNNPGNRRALSQILGKYNSYKTPLYSDRTSLPLGVVGLPGLNSANSGSTYKLDTNTEPDHNISWEPFTGTGSRGTPNGVSPMFISNMTGYGYSSDLAQDNFIKSNPSTNL